MCVCVCVCVCVCRSVDVIYVLILNDGQNNYTQKSHLNSHVYRVDISYHVVICYCKAVEMLDMIDFITRCKLITYNTCYVHVFKMHVYVFIS